MFENNSITDDIRALGVEAEIFCADVSNYGQCEEMVKAVKERFGSVDILINNAGITRDGLMARMSEEQYDLLIPDSAFDTPMVQRLLEVLGGGEFRARLDKLGGYQAAHPGRVRQRF